MGSWVSALLIIIRELKPFFEKLNTPLDADKSELVKEAIVAIDELARDATAAPAPTAIYTKIDAVKKDLDDKLGGSAKSAAAMSPATRGGTREPSTLQSVRLEIATMSSWSWAIILLVTTLTGAYVLIFSSNGAGFGDPADYFVAFFWGAGLPTGANLLQATSTTAGTAFLVPAASPPPASH